MGGLGEAMNALGLLLEEEYSSVLTGGGQSAYAPETAEMLCDAIRWYFTAAEHGVMEAACNLAFLISRGDNRLTPTDIEAVVGEPDASEQLQRWLVQSIAMGHPRSSLFKSALEQFSARLTI